MTLEEGPHQRAGGTPSGKEDNARKELDAIYLVLDCIIDLGLGDRGLSQPKQ